MAATRASHSIPVPRATPPLHTCQHHAPPSPLPLLPLTWQGALQRLTHMAAHPLSARYRQRSILTALICCCPSITVGPVCMGPTCGGGGRDDGRHEGWLLLFGNWQVE